MWFWLWLSSTRRDTYYLVIHLSYFAFPHTFSSKCVGIHHTIKMYSTSTKLDYLIFFFSQSLGDSGSLQKYNITWASFRSRRLIDFIIFSNILCGFIIVDNNCTLTIISEISENNFNNIGWSRQIAVVDLLVEKMVKVLWWWVTSITLFTPSITFGTTPMSPIIIV